MLKKVIIPFYFPYFFEVHDVIETLGKDHDKTEKRICYILFAKEYIIEETLNK